MKKIIITGLLITTCISCTTNKKTAEVSASTKTLAPVSDAMAENAVIYEANIRHYSPEGTFNAFAKDLPELKKMGVKIIWIMPIYPISMKNRKTTDGRLVSEIKDPKEQAKYLGSYYAISDYTAINPDMGTKEDFRNLVKKAHENGMYVILDWVANHTGWDHKWITEHPEYYHKNAKGEVTDPLNPETGQSWGWTDVAHLDYGNKDLFPVMTNEMLYWIKNENVDGFRCDVADNVPAAFWEFAIPKLKEVKPVFMLAESNKNYLLTPKTFDMGYGWDAHHTMNDIYKGSKTVKDFDNLLEKIGKEYGKEAYFMNFTSNHDENSWQGTEYERMGEAVETFTALTYTMPGLPLIYTGQEYDLKRRLKFFEKDSIPKTKAHMFSVYEQFGALKNSNIALNGAKKPASYKRLATSSDSNILAFEREKEGKKVVYIGNLSKADQEFTVAADGTFTNYKTGKKVTLTQNQKYTFKPWQYWVLTSN